MERRVKQEARGLVLYLSGNIDTNSSEMAEQYIMNAIKTTDILYLDFKNVDYVSSAGLRVLLQAEKKARAEKRKMILTNINDTVEKVLKISGFLGILTVE